MKISVIVPVYNAEKTIQRAISSVKMQDYQKWEMILVDDGSRDNSLALIQEEARKDDRIKVVSQENAGPGKARQRGVEKSDGEYLFFLDADDYLPKDAFSNLMDVVFRHPYDVVKGLYYNCREDKTEFVKYPWTEGVVCRTGTEEEARRYHLIKTSSAYGYLWGTLYKKTFLEQHKLVLDEIELSFMEDTVFNLQVTAWEPEYYVLCKPVYYYMIGTETLSTDVRQDYFQKTFCVVKEYLEFLERNHVYHENRDLLIPLTARCFCWAVISSVTHTEMNFADLSSKIRDFAQTREVQKVLTEKEFLNYLFMIANKAESLAYSVCFFLLRLKAYKIVALMFWILKKPMNAYVRKALK